MRIVRALTSLALVATLAACAPDVAVPDGGVVSSAPSITPSRSVQDNQTPRASTGVSGCPELPSTFTGEAGSSPLPNFPALNTLPKWNGDGMRFANEAICLLNVHTLGVGKKARATLPKRVEGVQSDCSDEGFVQVAGFGFCPSKNVFLIDEDQLESSYDKTGQTMVMMSVFAIMSFYWGSREEGLKDFGSIESHLCARGRIIGGLIKDGLVPASYEDVYGSRGKNPLYTTARDTGECP